MTGSRRRDRAESLEIEIPEDTSYRVRDGGLGGQLAVILREGFQLWSDSGQDPAEYRLAKVTIRGKPMDLRAHEALG